MGKKKAGNTGQGSRRHHLFVEVLSRQEKQDIETYCKKIGQSMSDFFRSIALADARVDGPAKDDKKAVQMQTVLVSFSPLEHRKLEYKSRLRGTDIAEFVHERLVLYLRKTKEYGKKKPEVRRKRGISMRYYLNREEHKSIRAYMKRHDLSSRHYLAVRALETIKAETVR